MREQVFDHSINYLHELSKGLRVNITETITVLRLPLAKIVHYFRAGSSKTPAVLTAFDRINGADLEDCQLLGLIVALVAQNSDEAVDVLQSKLEQCDKDVLPRVKQNLEEPLQILYANRGFCKWISCHLEQVD